MIRIVLAALLTIAASFAVGQLLLRRSGGKLYGAEEWLLSFVAGSGALSLLVLVAAQFGWARRGVFQACGVALIVAGLRFPRRERLPKWNGSWRLAFAAGLAVFGFIYLIQALAPEHSPAGSSRHLVFTGRTPHGVELLFLFAFAIGRHQAAALVHLAFLFALPLLMLAYARRKGFAKAGVFGAMLTFVSPVVGVDGSSACTEVATATILFAAYYLFDLWREQRRPALLGLAALTLVYAASSLEFTRNGYPEIRSWLEIPLEAAILGRTLGGFVGPIFLLAPFAVLAAWRSDGRRLLAAAAVCAVPFLFDHATVHLIPALPFLSLAMGLAFAGTRFTAPVLLVGHTILSLPAIAGLYCDPGAWRIQRPSIGAALGVVSEDEFLRERLPGYPMIRRVDALVPQGAKVLSLESVPAAYTQREISRDERLIDVLKVAITPDLRPTRHVLLHIGTATRRVVEIRNTAAARIYEVRLYQGGRELPRAAGWRLRAEPDSADVQRAFDNSPVTWFAGQRIEVHLGRDLAVDDIQLETSPVPQFAAGAGAEIREVPRPPALRRAAIRELKHSGIGWLITSDSGPLNRDLQANARLWGISAPEQAGPLRLYRFE